jgi:hypothetical protein
MSAFFMSSRAFFMSVGTQETAFYGRGCYGFLLWVCVVLELIMLVSFWLGGTCLLYLFYVTGAVSSVLGWEYFDFFYLYSLLFPLYVSLFLAFPKLLVKD